MVVFALFLAGGFLVGYSVTMLVMRFMEARRHRLAHKD